MKVLVLVALAACGDNLPRANDPHCDDWHQWGSGPAHTGASCSAGQPLERVLADLVIDPLVSDEIAGFPGGLIVHYQVPLVDGERVFMLRKGGVFTPCVPNPDITMQCRAPEDLYRFETQTWDEVGYAWEGDALVPRWTFASDWKPPLAYETMFQPALVDGFVAIPAAHGGVALVDARSGELVRTVAPFGDDASAYTLGVLAVDHQFIYYNAIQVGSRDDPYGIPIRASLVAIDTAGDVRTADYATLVPGAPAAGDACVGYFDQSVPLPWPPPPNADGPVLPKSHPCGAQVPGWNSTPAIAFDGTLYIATHAEYNEAYSYITAVNPGSLVASWATSLRDHLHDGCGVGIPYQHDAPQQLFGICRDGAPLGIDPATGLLPAPFVDDGSSSSPVALPQGGVLYGAFTSYNNYRGHLLELDGDGTFVGSFDFGWDTTPAVADDHVYVKDNHYGDGSTDGPYFITELDTTLAPVWQFQNTEANSCTRQPDGTVTCKADHPHGFEWCINAPAVDREGTLFGNSEDGNLYAIRSNGELRDRIFLEATLGASYTPLAIDHVGRIYALNAGHMIVVGAN